MKILLSNDDGIDASGILAAKHAVSDFGDTILVAPSSQQSGIGHALTLFEPLRVNKVRLMDDDMGYGVSGTPTDAITIGIFEILDKHVPMIVVGKVISRINFDRGHGNTSLLRRARNCNCAFCTMFYEQNCTDTQNNTVY